MFPVMLRSMSEISPNDVLSVTPLNRRKWKACTCMLLMLTAMLNLRVALAGVVIEERVTDGASGPKSIVTNRTLMVQDDKEKFLINDHQSLVIDADAGTVTALDDRHMMFRDLPFGKIIGTNMDPNRLLYMAFTNVDNSRKVAGFKCRDYKGVTYAGPLMRATTACFSTGVAGADEFGHFMKSLLQRVGSRARGVSIPAGIPVVVESTHGVNPSFTPVGVADKEALQFKNRIAKIPAQVTREEVIKITSKKLSRDVFSTPRGYTRVGPEPD